MPGGATKMRKGKPLPVNCTRTLATESGMVVATFDCLNCGAEGDLRSPTCYTNVLNAFVQDLQIDAVVLADLNHRQYGGALVDVLRGQAGLVRAYERASARPGAATDRPKSKCGNCTMHPSRLFLPVSQAFARAPVGATANAEGLVRDVEDAGSPEHHEECPGCVGESLESARHLAERAVESRAALGKVAYNVEATRS